MLPEKEPFVNVGILTSNIIQFELHGEFSVYGFNKKFNGRFTAETNADKIILTGDKDKLEVINEIIFEPDEPVSESFIIKDVVIGVKFHWERKEKQRFTHTLKIIADGGSITAINIIPI